MTSCRAAVVPAAQRVVVGGTRLAIFQPQISLRLRQLPAGSTVIHGGADGVDLIAGTIASDLDLGTETYPVTPAEWQRFGKRAGPRRNRIMLRHSCPNLVLAFWDGLSPGTSNLIQETRKLNLPLEIISLDTCDLPVLRVQLPGLEFGFSVWQGRIVGGDAYGLELLRRTKKLCVRGAYSARTVWQHFREQGAVLTRINPEGVQNASYQS